MVGCGVALQVVEFNFGGGFLGGFVVFETL